jgi:hypothetical protein
MLNLNVPPDNMAWETWLAQLRQMARQDLPAARQAALLRLIWQESFQTRAGLINRVEALLDRGCFGTSPHATFQKDFAAVRQTLDKAGHRLVYNRCPDQLGYYIEGRPVLDEKLQRLIAGAVAEVDPEQIAISKHLTPAQRFQQGNSMIRLAERVATYRLRQRQPDVDEVEARRIVRGGRGKDG